MKSDTIKTVIGLIVIGGIVVATFLYGNAQRQAQLSHDQDVKKQQEAKATPASPEASPSATATATAGSNTAPVASPAANSIQGSASPTPSATATPAVASASTVPNTGGSGAPAPLPDTGPELIGLLGMSSIGVMAFGVRRSRKATLKAMRTKRL